MKKYLLLFLLILLIPAVCWSGFGYTIPDAGQAVASGGVVCEETPTVDTFSEGTGIHYVGFSTDLYYSGLHAYQVASEKKVCSISFKITGRGTITDKTYTVKIWTLNVDGYTLGDVITNGTSGAVTGVNEWDESTVNFEFATHPTLAATTDYCITVEQDQGVDGTNDIKIIDSGDTGLTGVGRTWKIDKSNQSGWGSSYDPQIKIFFEE